MRLASILATLSALMLTASAQSRPVALGGWGGRLDIPAKSVLVRSIAVVDGWKVRDAVERDFAGGSGGVHRVVYPFDSKDRNAGETTGAVRFSPASDGSLGAEWTIDRAKFEKRIPRAEVRVELALPAHEGETFAADGAVRATIGEGAAFGRSFAGNAKSVVIRRPSGETVLGLELPDNPYLRLEKERDWGLSKYVLHIHFQDRLQAKMSCGEPVDFREEGPRVAVAGKGWIPIRDEADIQEGSALDFSAFRGTDAPAGKDGPVVVRNGHFEFENAPGVPRRFYGVNVCSTANVPPPESARPFARRLRMLGYNAIRFHHHETSLVQGSPAGATALNPERMARFDALMKACIDEGVYMTTDLFVSRSPISWKSIGENREGNVSMTEFKALVQLHEGAYSNFIAFARAFLGHVNPLTGRRIADEPAMMSISLVNEGNLSGTFWAARNAGFFKGDRDLRKLHEIETAFARRVRRFLREEMKCRIPCTNLNNYFWDDNALEQVQRTKEYDFADDHFYVDHPWFIDQEWRLPSECPNGNPLLGKSMGMQRLAVTRPVGMPFTVSEYNFSAPGRFRGVGGILTGAAAALQDWDGLLRFAWTHSDYALTRPDDIRLGYFDMSGDPLGLATERASICLFLRRDLEPLARECVFVIPPDAVGKGEGAPASYAPVWDFDWAGWYVKTGTAVADRAPAGAETLDAYPFRRDAAEIARQVRKSSCAGGRIAIDRDRGTFAIDTPRTVGGFAEGGRIAAGALAADIGSVPATVWASSLDMKPIGDSSRILLTHLTDVRNSGMKFGDAAGRILLDWGRLPHLMQAGSAEIALTVAKGPWRVWALSAGGRRIREVPCAVTGGTLRFRAETSADASAATFLYECVR